MSASSDVINPQKITEISQCWKEVHLSSHDIVKPGKVHSADASSSSDELNTKVRKPYTITKQRERWTETEHQKFLEALKLHGRGWRRIEEYIGTKTAVQIRSHAQKFFSKLEREASTGSSGGKLPDIAIPPPRPKRKPSHPYPKKAGGNLSAVEDDSKEAMLSSPACRGAAHAERFQMGFVGSGQGGLEAGCVAENPVVHGQPFDHQGSVKIFGKAVSIGKVDEGGFYGYAKSIGLVRNDNSVPAKQSSSPEPIENMEFSSSVEVRNTVDSFSQTAMQLDRNVSQLVASQPEGTGESFVGACGYDLREADVDVGVSVNCCKEECKVSYDGVQAKHESSSLAAAGLKEDEKQNVQLSHVLSPVIADWMNNVLYHQNANPVPPVSTSGVIDGHPGNSLNYWQFIQASAMNYAVYTAAMAAAVVAGWKAPDSREADKTSSVNELQLQALSSLPWWPYGRFMPPVYVPHPQDTVQQLEVKAAIGLGHVKEVSEEFHLRGEEPDAGLKGTDILDTCETPLEAGHKCNERMTDQPVTTNPSTQMCMLETSCLTRASATISPDSDSQLDAAAILMPVKLSEQSSYTEKRDVSLSRQNLYISSDDFEEQSKKQREGSSSGSNTPVPVSQSSESKKKNQNNTSEDFDDGSSDSLQISTQQCVAMTAELLNQRVKHAEKGRKHQQRDARHGWGGDPKRFKSCLHEMEVRKEVSQEGRKAFQALFASKSLPQTFPAAVDRELMAEDKRVSDPIVSRDEARATTGCRCIKFDATHGEEAKCTDNASSSEVCNDVQMSDAQPLSASSKGFTVSSSSGFVPYRKKFWLEPSQVAAKQHQPGR